MTDPVQEEGSGQSVRALDLPGGVHVEWQDHVVRVELRRPQVRNAQTFSTWQSLARVADELSADDRIVLISGEGQDFSAGLDLRMLRPGGVPDEGDLAELLALDDAALDERLAGYQEAFTCWQQTDAIVVCAVRGNAIGAGFQLALAADLIIAAESATFRVGEPELGLIPDLGGSGQLLARAGRARALELCLTGRPLGAAEAAAWGLVSRVVADEELEPTVRALIDRLGALPAGATRGAKRLVVDEHDDRSVAERSIQIPLLRALAQR
ncbi:enoyl-CoA hydratase/isomerase family protein [Propionibacteriaceae bacterium Y1685]